MMGYFYGTPGSVHPHPPRSLKLYGADYQISKDIRLVSLESPSTEDKTFDLRVKLRSGVSLGKFSLVKDLLNIGTVYFFKLFSVATPFLVAK